jgi:uncharacterized protein
VTTPEVLEELARHAPVFAALGNNDGEDLRAWGAQPEVHLEVEGVRIAMVHDTGRSAGREGRLRRRFPEADLIVFGHSHIPVTLAHDGVLLVNPGSPTWKRRQPAPTFGVVDLKDGRVRCRIVDLPEA